MARILVTSQAPPRAPASEPRPLPGTCPWARAEAAPGRRLIDDSVHRHAVYALVDPLDDTVRYLSASTCPPSVHLLEIHDAKDHPAWRWCYALRKQGYHPTIRLVSYVRSDNVPGALRHWHQHLGLDRRPGRPPRPTGFLSRKVAEARRRDRVTVPPNAAWNVRIYALVDPRDDRVRYVGKTAHDLDVRLEGHLARPTGRRMRGWLAELRQNDLKPVIVLLTYAPETSWGRYERSWIRWIVRMADLLNHDAGGALRSSRGAMADLGDRIQHRFGRYRARQARRQARRRAKTLRDQGAPAPCFRIDPVTGERTPYVPVA